MNYHRVVTDIGYYELYKTANNDPSDVQDAWRVGRDEGRLSFRNDDSTAAHPGSCMRTSENIPSRYFGE
jgi:hypothetical protein